jgi:hypothetical protein
MSIINELIIDINIYINVIDLVSAAPTGDVSHQYDIKRGGKERNLEN